MFDVSTCTVASIEQKSVQPSCYHPLATQLSSPLWVFLKGILGNVGTE